MLRGLKSFWTVSMVSLVLVAGCSSAGHKATGSEPSKSTGPALAQSTGTVVGTLGIYGGKFTTNSCGCVMAEGTLKLSDGHGTPLVVGVGKSGRFSTQVPVGRYSVEAGTHGATHWPMGSCGLLSTADESDATQTSHPYLMVRQSRTTHVAIGCLGL
jgi:hypothetical protein